MRTLITILIVNYNSASFVLNTLYCLKKITKNTYKVLIMDNGSELEDFKKLNEGINKYSDVKLFRKENFNLRGSLAHGTSLNELVKKVDTSFFSILDADATWLRKNWDEILIKELNHKLKVIGTQASGNKPKDFPLMFAILFETKTFNQLNIDFRPEDTTKLLDTGHDLKEKYLSAGYTGKVIEMKSTRTYKHGHFKKLIGVAEYYLNNDYNHIFASHFGRGSSLGKAKYKKLIYKLPLIGTYLLNKKGKKEKQCWLNICKNIVNKD